MKKTFFPLLVMITLSTFGQSPDIILYNGKIFTGDERHLYVEALAVKGNLISLVGKNEDVKKTSGKNTQLFDLGGKTVIAGINDAHYHHTPTLKGTYVPYPNNGSEPSWEQLQQLIEEVVRKNPKGEFIHVTFGIKTGTEEKIDRYTLDLIAPDHPLILSAFWGHITILNSAAIHALGISETIQDPPGGSFERVPGKSIINGRVYEQAQFFLNRYQLTNDDLFLSSLDVLQKQALHFGITSIQNMCTGASPEEYVRLLPRAQFPLRLRLIRWGQLNPDRSLNLPAVQLPKKIKELPMVSISGTKWMMDGTPLEWSAAVIGGYKDKPGSVGYMNYEVTDFVKMINDIELRNDQPIFHIVGNKTLSVILDELDKRPKTSDRRFRIEHGEGMLPQYFEKAKRNGVMVVQNPTHLALVPVLHQRWQGDMERDVYKMKSMMRAGIPVAIGSDGPINPYLNMMLMCINPYNPAESFTREEVVVAYTKTAAYAEFEEGIKGTLTAGKVADLVVLSQDLFTVPLEHLPATSSVLTMIDGKVVFKGE